MKEIVFELLFDAFALGDIAIHDDQLCNVAIAVANRARDGFQHPPAPILVLDPVLQPLPSSGCAGFLRGFKGDVRTWSDRHGIPMGAVAPIAQVMDLGREWYPRHADPDWRKWTVREAAEIFRKVGLVGDFWEIPVTEAGF